MNVEFNARYARSLRHELAEIEYCLRIRTEDIARLNERKAQVEAQLQRIEGENANFDEK
ncbi:hypothetical protein [Paenibacillus abyssi]|uniref:Uncharacterized protein n=1 Tax=Paenibacillus abyssi TaxID=1340531 RepID=A0A917FLV6_9BACL|nr:hypothetical protein [Paenibacillus abyssi]GGF88248.1 hypothetical protein GCM10010916_01930 [Paenibacillus abyssi]